MKPRSIDLEERYRSGLSGPATYHIDGKRVDRAEFDAIKRQAYQAPNRLECLSNARVNGAWTFYSVARLVS